MALELPALVHQTTTTTGTGTYSLVAAAGNFQNYRSYYASGGRVPYVATDGSTNFEIGVGTLSYGTPDTISRLVILASSNGGSAVSWGAGSKDIFAWRINGSELTPQEFGAVGDDSTDDSGAIIAWLAAVVATGLPGRLVSLYKCNSQIVLDLTSVRTTGIKITGNGMRNCGLDLTGVSSSPQMKIYSSSGDAFFSTFRDFAVLGSIAGTVLQVGDESYSTAVNDFILDGIYVSNSNTGSSANAVEANACFNCKFWMVANNGAAYTNNGDALRLRQCQFNNFGGSYSTAENGINFAAGYIDGNSFDAVDVENVNYGVAVGSANVGTNTFNGGTIVFDTAMVNQTAVHGYNSIIFNGTNSAPTIPLAPIISTGGYATGVVFRGQDLSSTPSMPASGTAVQNRQGMDMLVTVYDASGHFGATTNAQITNTEIGVGLVNFVALQYGGGTTVLRSGDSITLTYSTAPGWVWRGLI